MRVDKVSRRHVVGASVVLPLLFWYLATPVVRVHYSSEGGNAFSVIWNTQDRIYRHEIVPGQSTVDTGDIFQDDDFFMTFYWDDKKGSRRCIDITPKIARSVDIYLDANGRIDKSSTDPDVIARLKPCFGGPDPFRF